jgi:hypothetical protein
MSYQFNRRQTNGAPAETVSDRLFFAVNKTWRYRLRVASIDEIRAHRLFVPNGHHAYATLFDTGTGVAIRAAFVVDTPLSETQLQDHHFAMTTWWQRAWNDERALWGYPKLTVDPPTRRPLGRRRVA